MRFPLSKKTIGVLQNSMVADYQHLGNPQTATPLFNYKIVKDEKNYNGHNDCGI